MIFWDDRERQIDGKEHENPEEPRYDEVLGSTCTRSDFYYLNDEFSYNIVRTRGEVPEDEDFVEIYSEYNQISETSTIHLFFYNECNNLISPPYTFGHAEQSELPISLTHDGKRILKGIMDDFFFEHILPLSPIPTDEPEVIDSVE